MNTLNIAALQTDLVWEDKATNLKTVRKLLEECSPNADLAVVPEMFSTAFSVQAAQLAEPTDGNTLTTLKGWAKELNIAICGSYIACEGTNIYNRAFFLTPEGEEFYYDKRHLFRMAGEDQHFSPGQMVTVVHYRGWNIMLSVCYDLRFPVWLRNVNNSYDLLLCMANWPTGRRSVWDVLLRARALENQCFVCGVNRIGTDAFGVDYNGGSTIISPQGKELATVPDRTEGFAIATLEGKQLKLFREKFPTWKDADAFSLVL